jgi:cytochrome c oxidase subunit II
MKGQWGKVVGYIVGAAVISAAITLLLPLIGGGGYGWLPDLISAEGSSIDLLFWGLVWTSIAIFAIVGGIVAYAMVHFRAEPGDMSDGEHIHGNARMEVAWIVIPSIIVLVIGVLSYIVLEENEIGLYDEARAQDPGAATMVVDVRAFSFGWAFRYKDTDGNLLTSEEFGDTSSELVVPKEEVVRFNVLSCSGRERLGRERREVVRELGAHGDEAHFVEIDESICEQEWDLTTDDDVAAVRADAERYYEVKKALQRRERISDDDRQFWNSLPRFRGDDQYIDVNHAFWVPEARLKIDAVAGLRTYVQWKAARVTGPQDRYQVVCAELCGIGHNGMRNDMCVVDRATFDWWTDLAEDDRRDARCVNLRLMSCLGDEIGNHDEALALVAALSNENPEASCEDVEEQAA